MLRLGVALAVALWVGEAVAKQACVAGDGAVIARACFTDQGGPVGYDHKILGHTPEWTGLAFYPGPDGKAQGLRPWGASFDHGFFEDIVPRLADVDGDGLAEIIAVHTDLDKGARLVVLSTDQRLLAATAFIGQTRRWLAPAGVGDFDGDQRVEIAYIDRPHLAKVLVLVRYEAGRLVELGRYPDFTNHRIGDAVISGGLRQCNGRDSLVLADADWQRVVEVFFRNGILQQIDRGAAMPGAMAAAMTCR